MQPLLAVKNILILAVFYTVAITIALLSPTGGLPTPGIPHVDKVVHFVINGGLVFIWLFYFFLLKRNNWNTTTLVSIITTCFVYGILIEACQEIFTTSRQADLMDVLANCAGLIAGFFVFSFVKKKEFLT